MNTPTGKRDWRHRSCMASSTGRVTRRRQTSRTVPEIGKLVGIGPAQRPHDPRISAPGHCPILIVYRSNASVTPFTWRSTCHFSAVSDGGPQTVPRVKNQPTKTIVTRNQIPCRIGCARTWPRILFEHNAPSIRTSPSSGTARTIPEGKTTWKKIRRSCIAPLRHRDVHLAAGGVTTTSANKCSGDMAPERSWRKAAQSCMSLINCLFWPCVLGVVKFWFLNE